MFRVKGKRGGGREVDSARFSSHIIFNPQPSVDNHAGEVNGIPHPPRQDPRHYPLPPGTILYMHIYNTYVRTPLSPTRSADMLHVTFAHSMSRAKRQSVGFRVQGVGLVGEVVGFGVY